MDAETAFVLVGNFGRYQLLLASVLFVGNIIVSQQLLLMVIVGATPSNTTENEKNLKTIVTDFHLQDKTWVVDLIQSLLMGGYLIGGILFGQLSDTWGRRKALLISGFIGGITSLCSGFAPTWQTLAVTRFLTGIFVGGSGVIMFVTLTELLGKRAWAAAGMTFQIFFSLGVCTLSGLGLWLQNWKIICWVAGSLGIALVLIMFILIPESPRWLYSTGKIKEAEALFHKIAKRNGNNSEGILLNPSLDNPATYTILDMLRYRKLTVWLIVNGILWFTNGLVYYGLTLSAADLTSSLYLGIALSGAIEIPANILCIFMMDLKWLGRKRTLWILYGLSIVCCVASMFISHIQAAKLAVGLANKLAIVGCFNVCFIYTSEIFPTPLRSVAVGTSSTVARAGAIIAPFVPLLGNTHVFAPFLIFGLSTALSFILLYFLPQTLGKPLPQSIEEVIMPIAYSEFENESVSKTDKHKSRLMTEHFDYLKRNCLPPLMSSQRQRASNPQSYDS